MHSETRNVRLVVWVFIFFALTLGAGAYWFSTGKYQGKAAETINASREAAMTNTLVGYWTLDGNDIVWGDTTSEIKDVNPGTKHNGNSSNLAAGSAVPGRTGQGLLFNGTTDSISLGNVYNGVKTVAFWVKPNTTTQSFIDLNATATVDVNAGTVRGNTFDTPTIYVDGVATSTFPDTAWHHIAVTTGTGINVSAAYIGKIASSYFGGIMDDIRFYSDALTATQVADLYRASGAKEISNANHRETLTNGLVGYWTMDGRDIKWSDTSTEIKDISGNGNHGNAEGSLATTSVTPGKLGQGLSFNGTSDYVQVAGTVSINNLSALSLSVWTKPIDYGENGQGIIVGKSANFSSQGWRFHNLVAENTVRFYVPHDGGADLTVDAASNAVDLNQWTHWILTWDGSTDASHVHFYKNGGNVDGDGTNGIGARGSDTGELVIGNEIEIPASRTYNGTLDDVRIYNRVLSVAEIVDLYNRGK